MAFRYRLETILRLRQGLERLEERKLLAVAAEMASVRNAIDEVDRNQAAARRETQERMARGVTGAEVEFAAACEAASSRRRAQFERQLRNARSRHAQQLEKYRAARQQGEILEGLRERQQQAHQSAANRREQQIADEAFLLRGFWQDVATRETNHSAQ